MFGIDVRAKFEERWRADRLKPLLKPLLVCSSARGCFAPRPDHLGVASRVVRALLRKCTPEQPLSISFPTAESPTAKVEWGPHTLFDESKAARP